MYALYVCLCAGALVLAGLKLRHWRLRAPVRARARRRWALMGKVAPYVRRRNRDRPGQAVRRGAYAAWLAGKITKEERDLLGGGT